ncbi:hypothetical protein LguiB_010396 [Lonicera macranthoides]
MAKKENGNNLQVTFSKRQIGLFKKVSELCALYGTQVAIMAFSLDCNGFSFSHPSVEAVVDMFLTRTPHRPAHRNANLKELNEHLAQSKDMYELEEDLALKVFD